MPLEAVAIHSFDAPIMRVTKTPNELRQRIHDLYANRVDSDARNQDNGMDAQSIMAVFEQSFARGAKAYIGMFNDKPICVLGVFDDGQTDTKRLQYLAVHPENLGRNIEGKFIKQVYDAEIKRGVKTFMPADATVHQIMSEYELLRSPNW